MTAGDVMSNGETGERPERWLHTDVVRTVEMFIWDQIDLGNAVCWPSESAPSPSPSGLEFRLSSTSNPHTHTARTSRVFLTILILMPTCFLIPSFCQPVFFCLKSLVFHLFSSSLCLCISNWKRRLGISKTRCLYPS